jgi:hypothetical protein
MREDVWERVRYFSTGLAGASTRARMFGRNKIEIVVTGEEAPHARGCLGISCPRLCGHWMSLHTRVGFWGNSDCKSAFAVDGSTFGTSCNW